MSDEARRAFEARRPPATGRFRGCELAQLDPAEPDQRRRLILADHPEFGSAAIDADKDEIEVEVATGIAHIHD